MTNEELLNAYDKAERDYHAISKTSCGYSEFLEDADNLCKSLRAEILKRMEVRAEILKRMTELS